MPAVNTDRIEKTILLKAPLARVWRAISDAGEFGQWFGMTFEGRFVPGARLEGRITGTTVDAEVAKAQRQHSGLTFDIQIERVEPQRLFSFRWHPAAIDPAVDYSREPTTLIEFTLAETPDGVRLTVVESGFDRLPAGRRAEAFASNDGGWSIVVTLVERYLAQAA